MCTGSCCIYIRTHWKLSSLRVQMKMECRISSSLSLWEIHAWQLLLILITIFSKLRFDKLSEFDTLGLSKWWHQSVLNLYCFNFASYNNILRYNYDLVNHNFTTLASNISWGRTPPTTNVLRPDLQQVHCGFDLTERQVDVVVVQCKKTSNQQSYNSLKASHRWKVWMEKFGVLFSAGHGGSGEIDLEKVK